MVSLYLDVFVCSLVAISCPKIETSDVSIYDL